MEEETKTPTTQKQPETKPKAVKVDLQKCLKDYESQSVEHYITEIKENEARCKKDKQWMDALQKFQRQGYVSGMVSSDQLSKDIHRFSFEVQELSSNEANQKFARVIGEFHKRINEEVKNLKENYDAFPTTDKTLMHEEFKENYNMILDPKPCDFSHFGTSYSWFFHFINLMNTDTPKPLSGKLMERLRFEVEKMPNYIYPQNSGMKDLCQQVVSNRSLLTHLKASKHFCALLHDPNTYGVLTQIGLKRNSGDEILEAVSVLNLNQNEPGETVSVEYVVDKNLSQVEEALVGGTELDTIDVCIEPILVALGSNHPGVTTSISSSIPPQEPNEESKDAQNPLVTDPNKHKCFAVGETHYYFVCNGLGLFKIDKNNPQIHKKRIDDRVNVRSVYSKTEENLVSKKISKAKRAHDKLTQSYGIPFVRINPTSSKINLDKKTEDEMKRKLSKDNKKGTVFEYTHIGGLKRQRDINIKRISRKTPIGQDGEHVYAISFDVEVNLEVLNAETAQTVWENTSSWVLGIKAIYLDAFQKNNSNHVRTIELHNDLSADQKELLSEEEIKDMETNTEKLAQYLNLDKVNNLVMEIKEDSLILCTYDKAFVFNLGTGYRKNYVIDIPKNTVGYDHHTSKFWYINEESSQNSITFDTYTLKKTSVTQFPQELTNWMKGYFAQNIIEVKPKEEVVAESIIDQCIAGDISEQPKESHFISDAYTACLLNLAKLWQNSILPKRLEKTCTNKERQDYLKDVF